MSTVRSPAPRVPRIHATPPLQRDGVTYYGPRPLDRVRPRVAPCRWCGVALFAIVGSVATALFVELLKVLA